LKATVSGSFHRHMVAIEAAVSELWSLGINVLSPADPRIVDFKGEFLFVASDKLRSIKLVQNRHFEAIGHSDFLWLVCPDGYTGPSACMEIGDARRAHVPVYSNRLPLDITVQQYVEQVPSLRAACDLALEHRRSLPPVGNYLLDPDWSIENGMSTLDSLRPVLRGITLRRSDEVERAVARTRTVLAETFGLKD
jgi:hypothetical protein